eukprot:Amastigsp_a509600_5.p2 type:complete len:196 gc:universal Amastigsp_a509600_5:262-849(+)
MQRAGGVRLGVRGLGAFCAVRVRGSLPQCDRGRLQHLGLRRRPLCGRLVRGADGAACVLCAAVRSRLGVRAEVLQRRARRADARFGSVRRASLDRWHAGGQLGRDSQRLLLVPDRGWSNARCCGDLCCRGVPIRRRAAQSCRHHHIHARVHVRTRNVHVRALGACLDADPWARLLWCAAVACSACLVHDLRRADS